MTNIVNREDLEQQVIDFLRCQYPTTEDFVQYMAKCFKKHNYNVPNHLSHLSKDMRRLILDHLDFLDCISLALTCHNLSSIVEDNCYWFNRLKRDFYSRPFIGRAEATVSVNRKQKTIPIRCIDMYGYTSLERPGQRTLKGYLQKHRGSRIVSLPRNIQKCKDYFHIRLPVSVWPPCVVKSAILSNNTLYSVWDVASILVLRKRTDTELEQLFQISRVHDKFDIHSILWPLDKLRIAHIWENARWIEASATTKCDEAAATRKVKII